TTAGVDVGHLIYDHVLGLGFRYAAYGLEPSRLHNLANEHALRQPLAQLEVADVLNDAIIARPEVKRSYLGLLRQLTGSELLDLQLPCLELRIGMLVECLQGLVSAKQGDSGRLGPGSGAVESKAGN